MVKGSLEFTKNREFDHNKTRHNKYVKLRVVHAPGMPGTFSPPPRVSDSDMQLGGGEYVPGACATRKFTYLVRDLWLKYQLKITLLSIFSSLQLRNSLHVGGTRSSARERNVNCKDKTIAIRQRVFFWLILDLWIKHNRYDKSWTVTWYHGLLDLSRYNPSIVALFNALFDL